MSYDPYTKILLRTEEGGERMPLVASVCECCGAAVVDRGVHDRWHREVVR